MVAVNDAVLHLPFATALFSADAMWIRNRFEVISQFPRERYLAVAEDFDFTDAPEATYLWRSRHGYGLSDNPCAVYMGGGNSGFAALNLAYLKGAKRVILLGYDLSAPGMYWHSGYPWSAPLNNDLTFGRWVHGFDTAIAQLHNRGIQVINASPASRIQAFQRVSLDEALEG